MDVAALGGVVRAEGTWRCTGGLRSGRVVGAGRGYPALGIEPVATRVAWERSGGVGGYRASGGVLVGMVKWSASMLMWRMALSSMTKSQTTRTLPFTIHARACSPSMVTR